MLARIILLMLILPILAVVVVSPSTVRAQCTGTGKINVDNGLISTISITNFAPPSPTPGANVNCVTGLPAKMQEIFFQSYDVMKTLYYDQAKISITKTKITGDAIQANINAATQLYQITGNLTINNDIALTKPIVVFVGGNLYINSNLTSNDAQTGIMFVVKGGIYINRNIPLVGSNTSVIINAFLIDYTGFCSAWDGMIPPDPNGSNCVDFPDFATEKYLTINGSVISMNPNVAPQFARKKATETISSETIKYEAKYLVIMKSIFSRDQKDWREIQ